MKGCLLIHGFTGGSFEVLPLAQFLENNTDWKISIPTLPGHEEDGHFEGIDFLHWVEAAEKELNYLLETCDEVFLIGFSMGGMIASHLSTIYPVKKLVLLSTAYHYISPHKFMRELLELIFAYMKNEHHNLLMYHRFQNKLKSVPLTALRQFQKLVCNFRPDIKKISIPTFIAHGLNDSIVPPKSSKQIFQQIGSIEKYIMWIDNSNHLICLCDDNEILFEKIIDFLYYK
ncbi:MAG: carboxylesterase precursor [Bacillales bacterium]|jgi:esterase/lipase|nr:carboxylesterase precursor [Bacillales bacterium]